jgi:hemerythrin-like domain-containing protein
MDVIDLLIADHNRMRGLISRYRDASGDEESTVLASKMIDELQTHMAAEEKIFYRAVDDRTEDIGKDVDEGYEEHHVAKTLIEELETLKPTSDPWVAKVTVLIESVEHHIDEEEEELFPSVRSTTESDWRKDLGVRLDSEEVRLGASPLAERMDKTKSELQDLARDQDIPGRSSMSHDELAATVGE